jgi:hypothetical protein
MEFKQATFLLDADPESILFYPLLTFTGLL